MARRRHGAAVTADLIDRVIPALNVAPVDADLHAVAVAAFRETIESSVSLVDRTSFAFMRGKGSSRHRGRCRLPDRRIRDAPVTIRRALVAAPVQEPSGWRSSFAHAERQRPNRDGVRGPCPSYAQMPPRLARLSRPEFCVCIRRTLMLTSPRSNPSRSGGRLSELGRSDAGSGRRRRWEPMSQPRPQATRTTVEGGTSAEHTTQRHGDEPYRLRARASGALLLAAGAVSAACWRAVRQWRLIRPHRLPRTRAT